MNKELLFSITKKDFDIETFRSGGPGGQAQNKTSSGVRIKHRASGAIGESREEREQSRNKSIAFKRCVNSKEFQIWLKLKASEMLMEEPIETKLDKMMDDKNLKVEVKDKNGRWIDIKQYGVHINHCCVKHGCKYMEEDCPVVTGIVEQACPCEDCEED